MTRVDKAVVGAVAVVLGLGAVYVVQQSPGPRRAQTPQQTAVPPRSEVARPPIPQETFYPMDLDVRTGSFQLVIRSSPGMWYDGCAVEIDDGWAFAAGVISDDYEKRIHLADFSKGGTRYDWQRRTPTRVVVTCRRFLANPGSDSDWVSRPLRWVGGF